MTIDLDAFKAKWLDACMRKRTAQAMEEMLRHDVPLLVREVEELRESYCIVVKQLDEQVKFASGVYEKFVAAERTLQHYDAMREALVALLDHFSFDAGNGWKHDGSLVVVDRAVTILESVGLAERRKGMERHIFRLIRKEGGAT